MTAVLPDLGILNLHDIRSEKPEEHCIINKINELNIGDDLVSLQTIDKIKAENQYLHRKLRELSDYTLSLHKMIALLKKENAVIINSYLETQEISSSINKLSLNDDIAVLRVEEEKLQQNLVEKQNSLLLHPCHIETISNHSDAEKLQSLNNELEKLNAKVDCLNQENSSLNHTNDRLQLVLRAKADEMQVIQNKLNLYSSLIEEQSNICASSSSIESQPWIVHPNEIGITNQLLGTGAWGTVSLGTFRGLTVAVKQLHRLILSPYNRQKFLREMEISSKIRHPHIVQFMCCSQVEQTLLVVTEVMKISAREAYLSNLISKIGTAKILLHCGLALQYLHGFNPDPIIHRDISSCNVLLTPKPDNEWTAKLSDFGAANFLRDELSCAPGAAVYAAPEAYSSVQNTKLDVFSFGVLMIELLTSRLPDPSSREQQLQSITNKELHDVIASTLSRQQQNRPEISSVVSSIRVVFNLPSDVS